MSSMDRGERGGGRGQVGCAVVVGAGGMCSSERGGVGGLPHHYEVVSSEVAVQVGACGMDRSPWLSYLSYYILHCSYTKYYTSIILVSSENKIRLILNACVYIVRLDASISMRVDNDLCLPIFVGIEHCFKTQES